MKHIDLRHLRSKYSYTIAELAKLIEVQPATIQRWINLGGLKKIDHVLPIMIFGQELINFLKHRQTKDKKKLEVHEIFCCKCFDRTVPTRQSIRIEDKKKPYFLKGVCGRSGTKLCKIISAKQVDLLKSLLASNASFERLTESEFSHMKRSNEEVEMEYLFNPQNERVKARYFKFEIEANGKSSGTIDKIRKGIIRYEEYTGHELFNTFSERKAIAFKAELMGSKNKKGESLSLLTISSTLRALQGFLKWLSLQPGYKSRINLLDIEYLNLSEKDKRKAKPTKLKDYPTLEQIRIVLFSREPKTEMEMRDRAIIAFLICTGIRAGAVIGIKLKHVNIDKLYVYQDPKDVNTKFGKSINTKFLPVGDDIHEIVVDWYHYLGNVKNFTSNSPLFPKAGPVHDGNFSVQRDVLKNEHWSAASSVNRLVKKAFASANLHPYPPHRFRDTISEIGRKLCSTTEEQMAWAQNLGHESPFTTFGVYGKLTPEQHFEIIDKLGECKEISKKSGADEIVEALVEKFHMKLKEP